MDEDKAQPIRGITKLESGCVYAVAVPQITPPRRLKEAAEYFNRTLTDAGVDARLLFIPTVGASARLDELEDELAHNPIPTEEERLTWVQRMVRVRDAIAAELTRIRSDK